MKLRTEQEKLATMIQEKKTFEEIRPQKMILLCCAWYSKR
jgi:hypothetical protein